MDRANLTGDFRHSLVVNHVGTGSTRLCIKLVHVERTTSNSSRVRAAFRESPQAMRWRLWLLHRAKSLHIWHQIVVIMSALAPTLRLRTTSLWKALGPSD